MAERVPQPPEVPTDDPFLAALEAAEWDDEPLTDEDIAAMAEGKAEIRRGEFVTLDELRHQILGGDEPEPAGSL